MRGPGARLLLTLGASRPASSAHLVGSPAPASFSPHAAAVQRRVARAVLRCGRREANRPGLADPACLAGARCVTCGLLFWRGKEGISLGEGFWDDG